MEIRTSPLAVTYEIYLSRHGVCSAGRNVVVFGAQAGLRSPLAQIASQTRGKMQCGVLEMW